MKNINSASLIILILTAVSFTGCVGNVPDKKPDKSIFYTISVNKKIIKSIKT